MDETHAIASLRQGDLGGLEALVRKYQLRAIRTAYLIVRDRALAEDLVQAAFLRAYDRIGQFDASRPFGPWFLRSVVNDAIKAANRQARQRSLDAPASEPGPGAAGDEAALLADLLADPGPGPEALAEAAETRRAVWRALGQLSPAERGAIVLRYYLDRSEREMAAELNSPPGTIKWRLHSARQRLRAWLGPALGDAPSNRTGGK